RLPAGHLAAFLQDPARRYPDGRMPKLPVPAATARNIAAYLLLEAKPTAPAAESATTEEIDQVLRRLGTKDRRTAGAALVREKGCARCHGGIGESAVASVPIVDHEGCLTGKASAPRFALDAATRKAITAYLKVAGAEKHLSPFAARQRSLTHFRCHRC